MLACIKDWELRESRLQHTVDNQELEDSFKNLYLDDDADGVVGTAGAGSSGVGLGLVHLGLELLVVNHLICYLQFSILYLSAVTDKCDLGPLNNDGRVIKSCAALFFPF